MRTRNRWLWLIASAALATLLAAPAYACSCMLEANPEAFVAGTSIVANVTQQRIDPCRAGDNLDGCVIGTFVVNQVLKGPPASKIQISYHRSVGTSCAFGLPMSKPVIVAGYGDLENGFATGTCSQYQIRDHNYFLAAIRYRQKLAVFDRALEKAPADLVALRRKAGFLVRNGEIDQGLDTIDRLLAQAPNDRAGLAMKAELLVAKGKDAEAKEILDTLMPPGQDGAARELTKLRARYRREKSEHWLDFEGIEATGFVPSYSAPLDGASFKNARLIAPDFSSQGLRGADFTNAMLTGAKFDYADLTGATLRGAWIDGMFREAILTDASLEEARGTPRFWDTKFNGLWATSADLHGTDFLGGSGVGAIFAHGNLVGASFQGTDLSGIDLSYADLSGAFLGHVNLTGANLTGAKLLAFEHNAVDLRGANLEGANLDRVLMTSAVYDCNTRWPAGFNPAKSGALNLELSSCPAKADFSWWREPAQFSKNGLTEPGFFEGRVLDGVSFRGAWLPTDSFRNAALVGADLSRAKGHVDISGADLEGADLSFVDLHDWKFDERTNLDGVKLRGARINLQAMVDHPDGGLVVLDGAILGSGALLDGVDPSARQIVFLDVDRRRSKYPDYHLRNSDLRGFDLSGGRFGDLDLSGADLSAATLFKADFSGATLNGANLAGACYDDKTQWPAGFDRAAARVVYCTRSYAGPAGREGQSSFWPASSGKGAWREPPAGTSVPDLASEDFSEMDLLGAWLPGSDLDGGRFQHTRLKGANLEGASMRKTDLTSANLRDATLARTDLTDAILREADLRQASLAEAKLDGVDLTGAIFDYITIWPDGFDPVAAGATNIEQ